MIKYDNNTTIDISWNHKNIKPWFSKLNLGFNH